MPSPTEPPPWTDAAWTASVEAWTDERLAALGHAVTGPAIVRSRPWSIVRSVPTSGGSVHFKATVGLANDAAITALLAPLSDIVLTPLAADPARGWLLLPDGGERLREARSGDAWVAVWRELLPEYALLQRRAAPLVEDLAPVALDYRLSRMPEILAALLDDDAALRRGASDGITDEELAQLRPLVPVVADVCAELSASGLPETLQHDDLHDGNVLVGPGRAGTGDGPHLIDWGDTAVGHPLGTLLVTLNAIADHLELAVDDPVVGALRDAYLEPWSDLVPMARLRALVPLARWAAMVGRASTWHAVLAMARGPEEEALVFGDTAWLRELLSEAPPHS